ncbi:MAG: endonuclease/exonuclease/phosphatase family protein [Phycisphaeraceae bacterium]|nr:endonuclease/exonuclease/phosphatase family protein [Phycisphaeraceae bacterium]
MKTKAHARVSMVHLWLATIAVSLLWIQSARADEPVLTTQSAVTPGASAVQPAEGKAEELPWAKTRRHGIAEPKPRTPGALRIATYNIENLFDDKDDPKLTGRNEDSHMTKPHEHRAAAAKAIRLIDADVLCLQEVESLEALKWFRDEFLADMGYDYVVSLDAGDSRGIEQSVLSRFPLSEEKVWGEVNLGGTHPAKWGRSDNEFAGQPITLRRSPLRVKVTVPAGALVDDQGSANLEDYSAVFLVVHHKAGAPGGYWREAEARQFVKWANEAAVATPSTPPTDVFIVGDFNARAGDQSVRIYFDGGFVDALVAAGVKKPRPGERADPADRDREFDSEMITHASERTIDFILANRTAVEKIVQGSGFVLGTGARERGADWRTTPHPEGWASDHYPVVIDVRPVANKR